MFRNSYYNSICTQTAKDELSFTVYEDRRVKIMEMSELPALPYLLVAFGGAIGSVLRYSASVFFGARPLTTFAVNISGAFLIGLLAATTVDAKTRLAFGTGLLGGFTTFSAWQLEAVSAARAEAAPFQALAILFGSLGIGFAACWTGYAIGQRLR